MCNDAIVAVVCPNPDYMLPGAFRPHIVAMSDEELQVLADRWPDTAYFDALPASEASNAFVDSTQAMRYLAYKVRYPPSLAREQLRRK